MSEISPSLEKTYVPVSRGALMTGAIGAFLFATASLILALIFLSRGRGSEIMLILYAGLGLVSAILLSVGCFAASRPYGGGQITAGIFAILAGVGAAGTWLVPNLIDFNSGSDAFIVALASSSGTMFLFAIFAAIANQRNARGHKTLGVLTASSWLYYASVLATAIGLKFALRENLKVFALISIIAGLVTVAALICHGIGLILMRRLEAAPPVESSVTTVA